MAVVCARCGSEVPDGFRFCGSCGAPLGVEAPAREVRKTVTVLFADVVGSTATAERRDPETVRTAMARWFEEARAILERHGGTVEKFVGDAVMAVFGIPQSHEDDALRAVRAASELRSPELRIGVNTGEVVTGAGETLVTGDAVNLAARLEQAAGPGEVLLGGATQRLVRDAVEVAPVPPLELKGKSAPVAAYRLLAIDAEAAGVARRLDSPLVGRRRERERLRAAYEHVVSERTCHLFTLLGPAGVGKSRLALDFLDSADARIVRGRCLPYGEGITYWPLVEVVLQLGAESSAVIGSSPPETQLTFRRLLEHTAAERPVIVVFDDLQWAEATFLDLVEHVADFSRDAPLFLLCIARPELLDVRPAWGGGKVNATAVLLESLPPDDTDLLVDNLLAGAELDAPTRDRVLAAAGGNPLFVEEMIAMVHEGTDGALTVPPTIHALLQARLDRLGEDDRSVIERGAVEGEVFHQAAVVELAPERARADVPQRLLGLVRKELIRPSAAAFPGDEAFRFRHLLIRDAAYDALPKATRADLHERFAIWLGEHATLVEQDEIVGYHLEQAARCRRELGLPDAVVASGAATCLLRAARVASERGDLAAAASLMRRALELVPSGDARRLEILPTLADLALALGEFAAAEDHIAELAASEAPVAQAYALLFRAESEMAQGRADDIERMRADIDVAARTYAAVGDELGLAFAEQALSTAFWMECRAEASGAASARAVAHAERARDFAHADHMTSQVHAAAVFGPTPVAEALAGIERRLEAAAGKPLVQASVTRGLGRLLSLIGEFERARIVVADGSRTMREAGLTVAAVSGFQARGFIECRAGDGEAAVELLREGAVDLRKLGDHRFFSTMALSLVLCLTELGRIDEAEQWLDEATVETNPADVVDASVIAGARGRIAAIRGDHTDGLAHLARAVEMAERTDFHDLRTEIHTQHGHVLASAGRGEEAAAAFERALAVTRAKGATAWTAQIEDLLREL